MAVATGVVEGMVGVGGGLEPEQDRPMRPGGSAVAGHPDLIDHVAQSPIDHKIIDLRLRVFCNTSGGPRADYFSPDVP